MERETRERNPGNGTLWKGKTEKGARETESCGKRNRRIEPGKQEPVERKNGERNPGSRNLWKKKPEKGTPEKDPGKDPGKNKLKKKNRHTVG